VILGFDVSNHQQAVNFAAARAAGRDFCATKATEGVGFTDSYLAVNRKAGRAAGLVMGLYHFARAGDPVAEARYFANAVGPLQAGEFVVLDWEVPAADPVGWCSTWLATVKGVLGVAPLIYMNQSAVKGSNWTSLAGTYGLWLAQYDGSTQQPAVPYWGAPAMKQYSDAGSVLGVNGLCDVNAFYGKRDQLLAYGAGASTPTPTPEPDMQLSDLIESRIPSDVDPATGKGKMVPLSALLENIQVLAYEAGQRQAPTVDAAALAAALLADPAGVDALGKAIAAHLKLASS
jgi:GH25 family lysozyme M1 (1,4-beta-N-acetylmuramidase)